jgi:hypothetical protein
MPRNTRIHEKEVFVGLFDILGFSKLVENNELGKVADMYAAFRNDVVAEGISAINSLHKHTKTKDRVRCRAFSDSFLIYTTSSNANCFRSILGVCDFLFMAAVQHSLPIRGSITRGPLMATQGVEIGRSIVEAYKNEQKQEWIGCWISDECVSKLDIDEYLADRSLVKYEVPLKTGEVQKKLAFNWVKSVCWKTMFENRKNDFTIDQIKEAGTFGTVAASEWDIRRKLDNTRLFVKSLRVVFPAACGVESLCERVCTQEP